MRGVLIIHKVILIATGLLAGAMVLRAQNTELATTASDPNHRVGVLPVFFEKDSAKGSPYLVRSWLRGKIELTNHDLLPEPGHDLFFNYDKMNERLFATDGISKVWTYPNDSVISFVLADSNDVYHFEKVPMISRSHFLEALVTSEKGYSLYRRVITKYLPADFKNEGYYTTGRRFDQYTDSYEYFIVYPGKLGFRKLNLNVRDVKKSMRSESGRVDKFFGRTEGAVDAQAVLVLIRYLNEENGF